MELLVRVGWHLDLNGLEADAEMLELIVVFMKLLLEMRDTTLKEEDALSSTLSTLDKERMDVIRLFLTSLQVGDELGKFLIELHSLGDDLLGLGSRHALLDWRLRFRLRLRDAIPPDGRR